MSGTQLLGLAIGGAVLTVMDPRQMLLFAGAALALAGLLARLGLRPRPSSNKATERRPTNRHLLGDVMRTTMRGNVSLLRVSRIRTLLLAQWLPVWFLTGAESLIVA